MPINIFKKNDRVSHTTDKTYTGRVYRIHGKMCLVIWDTGVEQWERCQNLNYE